MLCHQCIGDGAVFAQNAGGAGLVAYLWRGLQLLSELPSSRIEAVSPLYESEPVGAVPQGWFLNAAAALITDLGPLDLLRALKRIEAAIGRVPSERWGPRVIDLDLLLFGSVTMESAELTMPHRELWNRRFVLSPLLDVAQEDDLKDRVAR
jgi:2-amino-4-hydroxy-6-hydroxymethyldihydropteridine diphosphokinase